ncbi:histidine kinase [Halorhodospira abdelmalekii]|uniref:FIST signal transduction protein n=1 Tax=Halorhodospira abdelmalekii TaxID=421629 RepID=UPI0019083FEC|nr:FIST C-terminal domain-containing protein [Halorhodospira abdelmalekii]MBK1733783.1 histidine kinase [Halorhodospira abdelmalekii]
MVVRVHFEPSGTLDGLAAALQTLASEPESGALMVLACDANGWSAEALDPVLKTCTVPVFGGIFPQVAYHNQNYERGSLLIAFDAAPEVACVPGLSEEEADFDERVESATEHWGHAEGETTLLVFVDGLSSRISALVEGLFVNFGLENNFIGGGAGSLSFQKKPCIFTNDGLFADVALLVRLPLRSSIGVTHGWQPVSDPLKVTGARGNVITTLDWEPAFTVYQRLVKAHSGVEVRAEDFFAVAKSYPFGMTKLGAEVVVRDPLMVENESDLVCVGEVPEGSFVRLLNGTPETLIEAAEKARQIALPESVGSSFGCCLFIDCISRVLFLGERIADELYAVGSEYPVCGAFTLGEIANSGDAFLEFYNKTSVFGVLYDQD